MKAFVVKNLVYLLLVSAISASFIKAADDLNLSKEQKTGLFLIQKLYAPLKKKLVDLTVQLISVENSVTPISKLTPEERATQSSKIKKVLGKKLIKIEKLRQNLNEIKQAVNRCPLSLKTDRAQQAIAFAGEKYLDDLKPSLIEKRFDDLQITIENILSSIK